MFLTQILILILFISSTFGWSFNGHKIVAEIAQALLPDNVIDECLSLWFNETVSLSDIAAHPDQFKDPAYRPYHYINEPGVPPTGKFVYDNATCPNGKCIIDGVAYFEKLFTTQPIPSFSYPTDPSNLAFLVHFMGDIHQPLHVSYEYDIGGNKVNVSFFGKITNLHSVWDGGIINKFISDQTGIPCGYPLPDCNWRVLADYLITDVLANLPTVREWQLFRDYIAVGEESFQIVNDHCYSFLGQNRRRDLMGEAIPLGMDYYKSNIPLVHERLMMAGARLAIVIENSCSRRKN